jgi:uncharacterized protein YggE
MKKLILALTASFSMLLVTAQVYDNTIRQRTINVNGTAQLEITPDEIYVQVELREYTKKNGDKIDIETIRNQFLAAAKSMGIADSDVVVQGYSGWDGNYWWYQQNKKKNPDMKAGINYEVKVKSVDDMDKLVDKLDDQATQNFSISRVWHSNMEALKMQLKIQAVKAAKNKATYLAEAIGEHVGQALTINDPNENNQYPQPLYYANKVMTAEAAGDTAPMNVDFKKIKLQFDVNVIFELK